jgi:hypothetical protein
MAVDPSKRIPTASSTDEQWISWHGQLKKVFGKKTANDIWLYAWSKRGGVNSNANTNRLSNYLEGNGIDIERSTLANIGEGVSDTFSAIGTGFKWAGIIILGVAGVILVSILIKLVKNPNQSVGQAVRFTPVGKATKSAKGLKK